MLATGFWELLFDMPQLAIVMGCLIPIVGIAAAYWYHGLKVRSDNDLKRSMVERGMTVEEIERVMSAGSAQDDEDQE
jgi:hypothetical protein